MSIEILLMVTHQVATVAAFGGRVRNHDTPRAAMLDRDRPEKRRPAWRS
jgi:hypothetical protein